MGEMYDAMPSTYILEKPYGVVVDTNLLIYLFEPEVISTKAFNRFLSCLILGRIKLIIPEQVKKEWDKHRTIKNDQYQNSAIKAIEKHRELANHIQDANEKKQLLEQIEKLKKMASRKYRYTHGLRARQLDQYISDEVKTIIPKRNQNVDKIVVDLALTKEAPFFGPDDRNLVDKSKKNQMADAVLFFTAYEYVKDNNFNYEKVFFITVNKEDFCPKGNNSILHPNLQSYADKVGLTYFNNLERMLNEVDPESHYNLDFHTDNSFYFLTDKYFEPCPNCGEEVHINADSKVVQTRNKPLGSYFLTCPICQHLWDTNTSPEDFIY
jgi:rRNA-processing protein FCF1